MDPRYRAYRRAVDRPRVRGRQHRRLVAAFVLGLCVGVIFTVTLFGALQP
jgi:hypothetical protein